MWNQFEADLEMQRDIIDTAVAEANQRATLAEKKLHTERVSVAKYALSAGESVTFVSEMTSLPIDEVQKLKGNLSR